AGARRTCGGLGAISGPPLRTISAPVDQRGNVAAEATAPRAFLGDAERAAGAVAEAAGHAERVVAPLVLAPHRHRQRQQLRDHPRRRRQPAAPPRPLTPAPPRRAA